MTLMITHGSGCYFWLVLLDFQIRSTLSFIQNTETGELVKEGN